MFSREVVDEYIGDKGEELREKYKRSDFEGSFFQFAKKELKEEMEFIRTRLSNFRR